MSAWVANALIEAGFWIALGTAVLATVAILLKRLLCWLAAVVAGWFYSRL